MDREKGIGPSLRSEGVGLYHCEHSWVERRELGLLSDWREWASTNMNPRGTDWRELGLQTIESMGAKCDKRSTSSLFPNFIELLYTLTYPWRWLKLLH